MEHESDGNTNCNRCARYNHQRTGKEIGRIANKRTSGDHVNYRTVKTDQNTEKSPRDLKRLAITQTPVENHQVTLE